MSGWRWVAAASTGVAALWLVLAVQAPAASGAAGRITEGSLITTDGALPCPLKHTDVNAEISGFAARVTVEQQFENPFPRTIEAAYLFPLPAGAAVDEMTIQVGGRTIRAEIKRREEAQAIYESARRAGRTAALLDQERPNIFRQSVANIPPGGRVKVTIRYVETLEYESGRYDFVFPMVVAPRYMPGGLADAPRIESHVTPEGTRAGHDVSLEVRLDAGVPLDRLECPTHDTAVERPSASRAVVRLKDRATIPNKDFILRYDVAGSIVSDAVLTHRDARGGFFTLVLQPPERTASADITPKELVFVLDTSGSMRGFPIEKAKEAMRLALGGLNPRDTFNLITFSGDTEILFPRPVPATPDNLRRAQEFLMSRRGSGGTEMMKAIRAALEPSDRRDHVRVVCFMTDGEVGNDFEILGEIRRHPNARVFAFGIGSSVNRFLLDNMARYGRGEVEYVGLGDDGSAAARRFHERVRSPLLTDISIDWSGLPVTEVFPRRVPDLFAARPVVVVGRYSGAAGGVVTLCGRMAGRQFTRELHVALPASEAQNAALASLWARRKIADLMAEDFAGLQAGGPRPELREEITRLGLQFGLTTQFTSFVAVDESRAVEGGEPVRVEVPLEMPDGMSYQGVFGEQMALQRTALAGYGQVAGVVGGVPGGFWNQRPWNGPLSAPAPPGNMPALSDKLHPALQLLIAGGGSAAFVRDGKAGIRVFLTNVSDTTMRRLRALGFELIRREGSGTIVDGRIPVGNLAALTRLDAVRYAAPLP